MDKSQIEASKDVLRKIKDMSPEQIKKEMRKVEGSNTAKAFESIFNLGRGWTGDSQNQ